MALKADLSETDCRMLLAAEAEAVHRKVLAYSRLLAREDALERVARMRKLAEGLPPRAKQKAM